MKVTFSTLFVCLAAVLPSVMGVSLRMRPEVSFYDGCCAGPLYLEYLHFHEANMLSAVGL